MQLINLHFEFFSPLEFQKALKVLRSVIDEKTKFQSMVNTSDNGIFMGSISHNETEIQFNIQAKSLAVTSTAQIRGKVITYNYKSKITIDIAPRLFTYIFVLLFSLFASLIVSMRVVFADKGERLLILLIFFGGLFLLNLIIYGLYRLEARASIRYFKEKLNVLNNQ